MRTDRSRTDPVPTCANIFPKNALVLALTEDLDISTSGSAIIIIIIWKADRDVLTFMVLKSFAERGLGSTHSEPMVVSGILDFTFCGVAGLAE